ncbi:MAG: hypothetical protein ACOZNI_13490 [Myxococcota bacterium]
MTLIAVYVGCLVLGGILIGASVLGFSKDGDGHELGHDGDLDHAADLDHSHDHAHDLAGDLAHDVASPATLVAATLLSLRFWTFALGSFGLTGLLLTLFGVPWAVGLGVSGVTGVGIGAGVSTALRLLSRDTVSSAVGTKQLGGRDAEVVLALGPGKTGKVRLSHQGQILELPATTREPRVLERGERVLVVEVVQGTADVTPAEPEKKAHAHPHPVRE